MGMRARRTDPSSDSNEETYTDTLFVRNEVAFIGCMKTPGWMLCATTRTGKRLGRKVLYRL